MQTRAVTKQPPAVPGVIDTIADGLTLALAYPLVMTLPVLLDAYFWLGWRLTPTRLTAPIAHWIAENNGKDVQSTIDALDQLGRSDMTTLTTITVPPLPAVPALLPGIDRRSLYELWSRPAPDLRHWWIVCLILVALIPLWAGLSAAYYVPLADIAVGRNRPLRRLPGAVARAWIRFLGLMALVFGLFALVLGPLAVLWGLSEVAGFGLGTLLLPVMVLAGIALVVFLVFTPEAIVVADVGPFRAMYYSVNVVRRSLWQTLGLVTATLIISLGLGEIWQRLADNPPGLLTAVIANAFFAGGITMAGMIFFNNRLRLLPQRQPVGTTGRAPRASN
jgi:hypothetical protein